MVRRCCVIPRVRGTGTAVGTVSGTQKEIPVWSQADPRDERDCAKASHRQAPGLAELQRWSGPPHEALEKQLGTSTDTRTLRVLEQVLQAEPKTEV